MFPDVEDVLQTAFAERLPIDYLAARSVDEDAAGLHSLEELRPGHVPGRIVQRSVEGEDVGLARHLFERQESAVLALFAGGIACHDAESPRPGVGLDERPDVSYTDDSEGFVCRFPGLYS